MSDSPQEILTKANDAVWAFKEKQFRTVALMLSVLVLIAVTYHYYRVLARGIGNPVELAGPTLSYLLILTSLLPEKMLSFRIRKYALLLSGFIVSFSAILTVGTLGSGYILLVLDAFVVHYFFEKKAASIIIGGLLVAMTAVSLLRIFGVLPALPEMSEAMLNGYTISKIFVVILTIGGLHFMDSRSHHILKQSITESFAAREKLRAEQSATNEFLESIPGIFFLFDENWRLSRWNQNLALYSGYTPEELREKDVLTFFLPADQSRIRKNISDIFVKGTAYAEADLLHRDGSTHPFLFTGRTVQIDDRTMACGIGMDLSEKRQLEKEVQQAQKMEALGALAGGVAHDLNNVLGGIIGYAEIVKSCIEDGDPPNINHLQIILQSCQRGAGIVQQILLFTRRTEEKKIPLTLYSIVRDAVALIRHTIPKSIDIRDRVVRDKTIINADPNQLHQVVMNICTNAWHAMRDTGGEMQINIETVNINRSQIPDKYSAAPGLYQRLTITDTGTGIPAHLTDVIFDPFYTSKPAGEGTGLGLAVVDKIVKKHDGFIQLKSEVGKGTEFSVFFPVHHQDALTAAEGEVESLPRGTEHLLIVDDEPTIREANKIILESLGYSVFTAENGEEGLAIFSAHPNDIKLVITDFSMPRKNGGLMTREMLQIKADLPVLLCTGYSETLETQHTSTEQFAAILHKPLQRTILAQSVRNILDGVFTYRPSTPPDA